MSKRDAIIPSAAWLSRFCSSNNSFGLLFAQCEAWHYRSYLKFLVHSVEQFSRAKPGTDFMLAVQKYLVELFGIDELQEFRRG
eukprot:6348234-Pyramimonas_sp.AAC.1